MTLFESDLSAHDMSEDVKPSFSTRKLAMEIRLRRLKSGLANVPARLLHREEHHAEVEKVSIFDALIDDILIYIGSHFLSQRDLWALTQVSRRCATLFMPLIYINVDLRLRRIYEVDIKNKGVLRNGNNRKDLLLAQKRFCKNLIRYPHFNLRIRTLLWYLDDREMRTNFWDILKNMINIERLWVCSPYGSPFCPDSETYDQYSRTVTRPSTSGTSLSVSSSFTTFTEATGEIIPRCRHLTLQGIISLPFAKHLIHPPTLESFSIDCTPRWTGPILSHLSSSPSSFPRLSRLTLIFPCGNTLSPPLEIDLLKSWYQVLFAFHRNLTHVTISSRLTSPGLYAGLPVAQPSISLLKTYVLCVFLNDNHSERSRKPVKWEKMETLTLKGRSMVAKNDDVFGRLYEVVPKLVIDSSVDKEDTLWHNQFAYNVLLR